VSGIAVYGVTVVSIVGVVLVGLGVFLVIKGLQARAEITAALEEEDATTPSGGGPRPAQTPSGAAEAASDRPPAPVFEVTEPVQPIRSARTAQLRIDEIKTRTLKTVGPYQKLPVDSPERQWFLNGLTIRNALSLAVMGFGVANLVLATGVALALIGGTFLIAGIPLIVEFAS
jgi:hypothetical protein